MDLWYNASSMTHDEIRALFPAADVCRTEKIVQLAFTGSATMRLEYYPTEIEREVVVQMVGNLTKVPVEFHTTVYAEAFKKYHNDIAWVGCETPEEAISLGEFSDHIIPKSASDMAPLITFFSLFAAKSHNGRPYISLRAKAAWDAGGIVWFFDNGEKYKKTGSFDDELER